MSEAILNARIAIVRADGLLNARTAGICPHTTAVPHGAKIRCTGCGTVFPDQRSWLLAMDEVRSEFA